MKRRSENVWRRCKSFSEIGEEFIASIPDTYDLTAQFESDRAGKILNELLESLPEHECDIFVLHYYFGEKVACVAACLLLLGAAVPLAGRLVKFIPEIFSSAAWEITSSEP